MIGIFDSGYGGLTILNHIRQQLPEYDYLYLGDNARAPYGPHSFEIVYRYTLQAVEELKKSFDTEDLAAIAIRWVLMYPEVSVVIPGASRAEQVRSNVKAAELSPLSEQQMQKVKDIYDRYLRESIHPQW